MKRYIYPDSFRADLKHAIYREKLTQQKLASMAKINQSQISFFLNGMRGLSLQTVLALWPFVYGCPFPERWPETVSEAAEASAGK